MPFRLLRPGLERAVPSLGWHRFCRWRLAHIPTPAPKPDVPVPLPPQAPRRPPQPFGTAKRPLAANRHHVPKPDASPSSSSEIPASARADERFAFPRRLLVYHPGTTRLLFIGILKMSNLLLTAFYVGAVPYSIYQGGGWLVVAPYSFELQKVLAAAVVPITAVTYITAPIVVSVHVNLPRYARRSPTLLRRFFAVLPPDITLDLTTISVVGKLRISRMPVYDLRPVQCHRLRTINYSRDTVSEDASRPWYMYRAIGRFGILFPNRSVSEPWAWDLIKSKLAAKQGLLSPETP